MQPQRQAHAAEIPSGMDQPGADTSERIRPGMRVLCAEGAVGQVVELLPSWAADMPTHIVVRQGPLVPQLIAVPRRWIDRIDERGVVLRVRRRQLARLSVLRSDDEIAAEVCQALHATPLLGDQAIVAAIEVQVQDHAVLLRGYVPTTWRALLAENLAWQVRGVYEVRNELIGDDELARQVDAALRRDRRLAIVAPRVSVALGQVQLGGSVASAEQCALAVLIASRVPGVRAVRNQLTVAAAERPHFAASAGRALRASRASAT